MFQQQLVFCTENCGQLMCKLEELCSQLILLGAKTFLPSFVTLAIRSFFSVSFNRANEIKAAALRTLTSIIHLDRNPKLNAIIDATGAASYHGFLPVLVRNCIQSLTDPESEAFPLPFATALFSFLYHLASYESGGDALVSCGMMEALLKVINWHSTETEHITFVTRAVRVIDLITNLDMQAFQTHGGLASFIQRLEVEVNVCRQDQPFVINPKLNEATTADSKSDSQADMEVDSHSPCNRTEMENSSKNTCEITVAENINAAKLPELKKAKFNSFCTLLLVKTQDPQNSHLGCSSQSGNCKKRVVGESLVWSPGTTEGSQCKKGASL
ncbi:e3 ubiquitin-protein ligase HUWE1 [Trichonephila clavipes]|nr:e3 ubiquitin-protein ligase HUWE1 [Trichonephila clavipes]